MSKRQAAALLWMIASVTLISISIAFAAAAQEPEIQVYTEAEDVWRECGSEEGNFEILFPGEPLYRHHVRDTAFGDIEENIYELTNAEGDFSAEYTDLPMLISLLASNRMIFRRAKDALLEEFKGKQVYFVTADHDDLDGRELGFETKRERGIARFYMKKKRLFVLVATVPKKGGDATNISKFIDSFEIMKKRHRKPHKYIDMTQTGKR